MKTFLHYCLSALTTSVFTITIPAQVPSITGFSPTSGPVGTTVTIINFLNTIMKKNFILLCFILLVTRALSQPGSNDPTFNPTDRGFGSGDGANSTIYTTSIQSDGKIVITGSFTSYNGTTRSGIARLNTDGSLDAGFNPGTGANSYIKTIAIQSDGKIVIGGEFTSYTGTARNHIARLNTDGSLDASFNSGTGANSDIYITAIQSDGKIIIGGNFTSYNGTARNSIARLDTDGSLDASFNPGTGANSYIKTIAIQVDEKIIIGGNFTSYNETANSFIARVNTNGTLDAGFNPGIGANRYIETTAIQSDGKIIIGGGFTSYNGTARNRIARLNADGTLDAGFNPGTGANATIYTTTIQRDGKIIIGGGFTSYNETASPFIARLNTNGTLDAGFNPGIGANSSVYTTSLQRDGKIIIGGQFTSYNGTAGNYIARLNTNGSLDAGFNPGTGANSSIYTTLIQSDGKIIIGGEFTSYNGTARNRIARLNTDGTLDAGFNPGTAANYVIRTTAIQSDGKIIIGGWFTSYDGTARNRIARLNTDGTLDAGFNPGTGANSFIQTTAIQSDGKIIIGGYFDSYNGTARNRIARLNTDGSLDAGFNPGTGANSYIFTTAIQSDGKIIIGGTFTSYNGTVRNRIARLNADGSLDAGFNPPIGTNYGIQTTAIQSDGKIIIGGGFPFGTVTNPIARLNTDGSLDAGFNPGSKAGDGIYTTAIQSDGKIIVGGWFTSFNGTPRNNIARLNTDGTLDAGFNPGTGANDEIRTTAIQSDGKIVIGGDFTSYNGTGRNRVARVIGNAVSCTPPNFVNNGLIVLDATCNNNDGNINIIPTSGTAPFMYSINGGVTYVIGPNAGRGFQNLPSGTYKLRLKDAKGCESAIVEREVRLICTTPCTPPAFVNNGLIVLDATCANNDGNINIIPTSGTAPFMYSINGGVTYVPGRNAGYGFQNLPSGTYFLRLKDAKGCESAIVEKQVKLICASSCTPPTFVNNGLIVLDASCGKSDGSISIIPTSGIAPFMYSINGGATYVAGPNAGYGFQNLQAGTYQLRLRDSRGCESTIVERTVRNYYNCPGTVSSNSFEASSVLSNKDVVSAYPNPNSGQFKLLLQNFQSPKAEVLIYDAKGTLIQKRSLNLTQNTVADFDLKSKAAGLYLIKVVSASGIKNMKVMVQ
jgi:uncharacterized delta-60 repeat protein